MSCLVIITGASRGLGRAIGLTAPEGSRVLDVSRSGGDPFEHVPADLSDPASWVDVGDRMEAAVRAADHDRIVFVHAAGMIEPIGFAGDVDHATYATAVLLNSAAGQVLGDRFLAAVHGRDARRQLCWITSGAARSLYLGWSPYNAGKAAANQWVRTVGAEQRERGGVEVCAIAPGVVATAMQDVVRDATERDFPQVGKFRDLHDRGALTDPQDAAIGVWEVLDGEIAPGAVLDLRDL